jgi:hypothetical protein
VDHGAGMDKSENSKISRHCLESKLASSSLQRRHYSSEVIPTL